MSEYYLYCQKLGKRQLWTPLVEVNSPLVKGAKGTCVEKGCHENCPRKIEVTNVYRVIGGDAHFSWNGSMKVLDK